MFVRQHDAHEFLIYLLEGLQKGLNRAPESHRRIQWDDDELYIERLRYTLTTLQLNSQKTTLLLATISTLKLCETS